MVQNHVMVVFCDHVGSGATKQVAWVWAGVAGLVDDWIET